MQVWINTDCYIRMAVDEYEGPEQSDGLQSKVGDQWAENTYRHLVNNSIGKNSNKFSHSFVVKETGNTVNGCMWDLQSFSKWLKKTTGEDKWEALLAPKIRNIVVDAILCAQEDIVSGRKRCFEIYGFDIMIDDNFHPCPMY